MRKLTIIFLVFLMFVGCTRKTENDVSQDNEKIILEFWTFWGSESRRPIIEGIIQEFNRSQDEIEVKHVYNPYGDIWTKELAAIASGNPPDIVINDINATAIRGQKKRAESLNQFLPPNYGQNFFPNLWEAMIFDDEVYGIPFTTDTRVLFYNKDLFREVGLDPEKPPKTWEELIEFGNRLDEKEGRNYTRLGFYPLYNVGADIWMMNAQGKNYIDKNLNIDLNNEVNRDVLNWIIQRRNHYGQSVVDRYQARVDQEQSHPFLTQELAMVAATGTFYRQIKDYAQDFELGVAFLPEYKEGTGHTSWGGGFVAEIPYGAKNPEASWKFIEHLTSKQSQLQWGALNFDNVAHVEASKEVSMHKKLTPLDQNVYQILDENMKNTLLTPVPPELPNYPEIVNPILDEIILQKIGVADGLQKAQEQLENEIQ